MPEFKTSSYCKPYEDCVAVAVEYNAKPGRGVEQNEVLVRDTKLGDSGPILRFTLKEWKTFINGVLDGEFDV